MVQRSRCYHPAGLGVLVSDVPPEQPALAAYTLGCLLQE
jgi:hypothetical protein